MTRSPFQDNSAVGAPELNALLNAHNLELIQSGCTPTKGTGDWDVDIASGTAIVGPSNGEVSVSAQTVDLNDPTTSTASGESIVNLVTINSSGTASATEGSAASDPTSPDIPSDEVLVAVVVTDNADSTIADSRLIDPRAIYGGGLLNVQTFTSDGTWNKPDGASVVIVDLVAGGGGGAGITGGGGVSGGGSGGGGGERTRSVIPASQLSSSVTVTVGTGGTGGNSTDGFDGADGTNTSFAGLSADGGSGGSTDIGPAGDGGGFKTTSSGPSRGHEPGHGPSSAGNNGGAAEWGGAGGGAGGDGNAGGNGGDSLRAAGGGAGGGDGSGAGTGGTGGTGELNDISIGDGGDGSDTGDGSNGTAPGGGGGGAALTGNDQAGGDGARGEARVWTFQ